MLSTLTWLEVLDEISAVKTMSRRGNREVAVEIVNQTEMRGSVLSFVYLSPVKGVK